MKDRLAAHVRDAHVLHHTSDAMSAKTKMSSWHGSLGGSCPGASPLEMGW